MKIQQIRNATLKITYGALTFLIDPWLQDKGSGFSAPTLRPEMAGLKTPLNDLPFSPEQVLAGVDHCLVTHIHPDHFTPEYLPKGIPLIVQDEADRNTAAGMGFTDISFFKEPAMTFGDVTIHRVPALHGDNAMLAEMMGRVSGYVLQGEEKTLYIAGDTVYYPGVEATLEAYRPDVIAVNCCAAAFDAGRLIMDLKDIEAVCRSSPEAIVIATHLDSVNHALLTSDDVRAFAAEKGLGQIQIPANGDIIEA